MTMTMTMSKVRRCLLNWSTHECDRVKGHAVRCRCNCGAVMPEGAEVIPKRLDETDPANHPIDCNCLFCIPGA